MPTVLRKGAYRFFFYAGDKNEPLHIHVERDDCEAKFWLDPVALEKNVGFGRNELVAIEKLVKQNAAVLMRGWHDYFDE